MVWVPVGLVLAGLVGAVVVGLRDARSEQAAGADLHHRGVAGEGVGLLDPLLERVEGVPLDVGVEGQGWRSGGHVVGGDLRG